MTGKLRLMSLAELRATTGGPADWGPWRLDPATRVLLADFDGCYYEVDLDRCLCSAEVLDWIAQVAGKTWADNATVAGLVRAVGDVLDPQALLCSMGTSKKITKRTVAARVRQAAARWPQIVAV